MASITLFLDEDVRPLLAEILRQRGYDATQVLEVNRAGKSDLEQLVYAVSQGRAMLTLTSVTTCCWTGNTEIKGKSTAALSSLTKFRCESYCAGLFGA